MFRKPVKKSVPPGPWVGGLPCHIPIPSRRQASDSDGDTESVMSGFITVEANQEQDTAGGLNNNDEFLKTDLTTRGGHSAYIYSWVPRLVGGELCIEGDLLDPDEDDDDYSSINSIVAERFITGPVIDRVNGVMVKTRNKTYVLEGSMAVCVIEDEHDEYTPFFVRDKFNTCIPENWEILVKQWIRIKAKNIQNRHTMSLLYNSMLSLSKSLDNNATNMPCNASVFSVSSTEPLKECNLSMNKQPAINIGPRPCDSPGSPQEGELEDFEKENDELVRDENHSDVTDDQLSQDDDDAVTKNDEDIESIAHDDIDLDIPNGNNVEVEASVNEDDSNQMIYAEVSTIRHSKRQKTAVNETLNFDDDRTYCKSCNMTFRNYSSHYGSKYHQKVVEEQKTCPEIIGPMHDYDPDMTYACEACRFSTEDIKIIKAHIELHNHKMKITKRDKPVLFCNLCHFSSTRNDVFNRHINTKMHKCNMQNSGERPNDERTTTTTFNHNLGKHIKKSRVSRKAPRE